MPRRQTNNETTPKTVRTKAQSAPAAEGAAGETVRAVDERAVGILEVYGLVCAFLAADAGAKAANVTLEPFDKNKPANAETLPVPLLVTIKFRGTVEDVTAAVEAGRLVAEATTGVVVSHVIPRPTEHTLKMLGLCAFDTD